MKAEPDFKDETGWNSLHYASMNGNDNIVLILLQSEANMNAVNNLNQTPLIIAA